MAGRVARPLVFFWCSIVMLVSRAHLVFLSVPLLCWYLAHAWFFLVFHCYVGISRTLDFFSIDFAGFKVSILCTLNFPLLSIILSSSRSVTGTSKLPGKADEMLGLTCDGRESSKTLSHLHSDITRK